MPPASDNSAIAERTPFRISIPLANRIYSAPQTPPKIAVRSRESLRGRKLFFGRRDFPLDTFPTLWHM